MNIDKTINADQPILTTPRLVLRPAQPADEALLELYAGDRRVAEGTRTIPHPMPPGVIAQFIDRANAPERDEDIWVLDGSVSGAPSVLGVLSLKPLDRQQSQIGFWVAPAFWNAGFASEAIRAMITSNPHRDRTLFAEVFQDNSASAHVLTNHGFDYLGDAEAYCVARRATVPTWTYIRRM